jgi:leucyl-tRNA synthetase
MKEFMYSKQTDQKWQEKWQDTGIYRFDETKIADKFYLLEMFSYPSGKTLHTGHWWNYGLSDSYGRLKRMQGYNVFHPPGFDAFGLPAENYAIKTGVHPSDSTQNNITTMEKQFCAMGTTYDWNYEVITCYEEYYKWTQWLFLKLFEKGLAYRKEAPVNWCPSCKTVLANEQAAGGICERCDSEVVRREMTQWFFKITEYAEELLAGLDTLDWPDKTKVIQKNWIGKSSGTEINFKSGDDTITVFTTRADTLMGVTYIVLAPEHPLVDRLTTAEYIEQVMAYRDYTAKQSEIERTSTAKEKTGVFTGAYTMHPISGAQIPIWIADYVLQNYGTGAVMAVPAHDERDFDFAEKYNLPIIRVVNNDNEPTLPFCDDGMLVNSGVYTGLSSEQARQKISGDLEAAGKGKQTIKYRLRDWLVSRQRYWLNGPDFFHK